MTEHVHEWKATIGVFSNCESFLAICKRPDCNETLSWREAERRWNATEKLRAEDAMPTYDGMIASHYGEGELDPYTVRSLMIILRRRYRAYADTLESK